MKTSREIVWLVTLTVAVCARNSWAANTVVVESKAVAVNSTGNTVGVFLQNDVDLAAMTCPIIFRQLTSGSFIASSLTLTTQGRIAHFETAGGAFNYKRLYGCTGTYGGYHTCPGTPWNPADSGVNFTSPDAALYTAVRQTDSLFRAGTDGSPASGTPSLKFTFGVTGVLGTFEIDTTCIAPGNHLLYAHGDNGEFRIVPTFTKGTITISCDCDCHTDPDCSGYHDIIDYIKVRDVANGKIPPIPDPNPLCPRFTTDVNCDGVTNATDKNLMLGVVFNSDDPCVVFCLACGGTCPW